MVSVGKLFQLRPILPRAHVVCSIAWEIRVEAVEPASAYDRFVLFGGDVCQDDGIVTGSPDCQDPVPGQQPHPVRVTNLIRFAYVEYWKISLLREDPEVAQRASLILSEQVDEILDSVPDAFYRSFRVFQNLNGDLEIMNGSSFEDGP